MQTMTLPDPRRNATSQFHTYCIAVGQGTLAHTCVIDSYAKEIDEPMKGREFLCGVRNEFVFAKIGIAATLADRPEKCFILKSTLLGTYGEVASWAMKVRADVLADCSNCFNKRVLGLAQNHYSAFGVSSCRRCCQWDLHSKSLSSRQVNPPDNYPVSACPNSPPAPDGRHPGATYVVPVQQIFG